MTTSDTNPAALREHMNRVHLSVLGGVVVQSGDEKKKLETETYSRPVQEVRMLTSNNIYITPRLSSNAQVRPPALNRSLPLPSPVTPRPQASFPRAFPNSGSRVSRPRSPAIQNIRPKQPTADLVKCNICSKSVERSKLVIHKMSHSEDRNIDKSNRIRSSQSNNVVKNSLKRKIEDGDKHGSTKEKLQDNQEFELIEIDLDDDSSENTSFKNDDKLGSSDIQCN